MSRDPHAEWTLGPSQLQYTTRPTVDMALQLAYLLGLVVVKGGKYFPRCNAFCQSALVVETANGTPISVQFAGNDPFACKGTFPNSGLSFRVALIGINEYFLLHLRRAMSEAPLLLFTVLVLYASFKLLMVLQENSMKKIILWSVIAGILSGMAGQSKLTNLACAGIAILGALILISRPTYFSQIPRGRTLLVVSFIVVCTSLFVFFASYSFFYRNTLHRVLTTFYIRGQIVEAQVNQYTNQTIQSNERHYILFQRIFRYPLGLRTNNTPDSLFHWINFLVIVFGLSYSIKQIWMKMGVFRSSGCCYKLIH